VLNSLSVETSVSANLVDFYVPRLVRITYRAFFLPREKFELDAPFGVFRFLFCYDLVH